MRQRILPASGKGLRTSTARSMSPRRRSRISLERFSTPSTRVCPTTSTFARSSAPLDTIYTAFAPIISTSVSNQMCMRRIVEEARCSFSSFGRIEQQLLFCFRRRHFRVISSRFLLWKVTVGQYRVGYRRWSACEDFYRTRKLRCVQAEKKSRNGFRHDEVLKSLRVEPPLTTIGGRG